MPGLIYCIVQSKFYRIGVAYNVKAVQGVGVLQNTLYTEKNNAVIDIADD